MIHLAGDTAAWIARAQSPRASAEDVGDGGSRSSGIRPFDDLSPTIATRGNQ